MPSPVSRPSSSFAGPAELAAHLGVSPRGVRALLEGRGVRFNPAGRCEWAAVWRALWGIAAAPEAQLEAMRAPLVTLEELAQSLGVHVRTVRRAGDRVCPRYALPRHVDLGPNRRRYLPALVEAWRWGSTPEPWLVAARVGPRTGPLGLAPRRAAAPSGSAGDGR